MSGTVLLLPSPLVGPAAYAVLAEAFRANGRSATVAALPRQVRSGQDVIDTFRRAVAEYSPELVVAHSNAGLVAPAVADGIPIVFMDAALPPSSGECAMAPPAMMSHLEGLADDGGLLPQWTLWWDAADVAPLFPDEATRHRVEADLPRLPLAYFRTSVRPPDCWESGPRAYLAFGETYADELAGARRLGWPTSVVDGGLHLHHLHDPSGVARLVLDLAATLAGDARAGRSV
ncbi:hypothetical protein V6K52_06995 [Knoellia sp. S7-12]|uniref:hypothetical protein n=1 Tax=Knoellia sp. S7-12 TaxID=3126698 RepID=UPI003367BA46